MVGFKSPHPPVAIPNLDIWGFLFEREGRAYADNKPLYIDGRTGRTISFAQLKASASQFGRGLKSQWGFQKGDVLGIFSPNTVDYPVILFGAIWAGVVCSTANPTYTVKELAFQLKDSRAKGIVTQLPMLPAALEAARLVGIPEDRVIVMDTAKDPSGKIKHYSEIRDTSLLGSLASSPRPSLDPKKDLAYLVYSSGTTGLPKGVMLTHENIVANVLQATAVERQSGLSAEGGADGHGDKQLAVLPFFHVYGLTIIVHVAVYEGLPAVVLAKFELEQACRLMQDYGITFAYVPPPIVLALAKHPTVSKFDLSSIKWLHSGAAPLSKEVVDGVWNRLTIPVKQGYGLSETSPAATVQTVLEWAKYKGSIGPLVPNMEGKIVDLEGKDVEHGQEGELWLKGPNVFHGYWNRPELATETFSSCGYFKTGDIGYVDAKGNLYITDRLKELIKYKGFQVAPAELEGLLLAHNDITDACVIPAFDKDRSTEVPRAYLVLSPGTARTAEKAKEIIEWLAAKVAPHKQLRGGVRFVDEVPKNASGKLLRRVLKDQAKLEDRAEGAKL